MTLQQLKYFCTIARELNFHKTAEIHHTAQPSLSNSIAKLFELTKYGRYYSEQLSPILEHLDFITYFTMQHHPK